MFWMIVTRFFCKTEILRDNPCIYREYLKKITEKSRIRDRIISYSKYFRRGTLFIQKKVGSALTETENHMHFSTATHDFGYRLSTDDK
jgi:hypothetical protein